MFNTSDGYSLSDIAAVSRGGEDGFFGGNGWWIILLFLFAGGWNNGGFFGGGGGVTNDVGYSFDIHDLTDGIRDLTSSTAQGFYNVNTGMLSGFANAQQQMCNTGFEVMQAINGNTLAGLQNTNAIENQLATHNAQEQLCCCQTQNLINSNFADLRYNLATEACAVRTQLENTERDLLQNANDNTRQILDFLVQDRINALQSENAALRGQISQSEQNAYLINALRPVAEPAYIVANPYTGYYYNGTACACNGY